jgi:hypothetical protein
MRSELRTVLLCAAAVAATWALAVPRLAAQPRDEAQQPSRAPDQARDQDAMRPAAGEPAGGEVPGEEGRGMPALLGPQRMGRESSGTSWQPESSPYEGLFRQSGAWQMMLHAAVFVPYDDQEGQRGAIRWFSTNWVTGTAARELGPGRLGLRAMLSAEPWTVGRGGYPLLLATGETANGRTPLVDRQHPNDLFEELAATYSMALGRASSLFAYVALPGEPALGPPAYMYRFSAMDNPEVPLSYHWLDSTHTTYGVTTLGWTLDSLKVEGSAFRGREPDQVRTGIESPSLDSYSFRATLEPDPGLTVQGSYGFLKSPEQLAPGVNVVRSTVSVMYNTPLAEAGNLQTTFAWGRNQRHPGRTTDAWLFEGEAAFLSRHTLFFRLEEIENDELVQDIFGGLVSRNRNGQVPVAVVSKVGGGYVYDLLVGPSYRTGVGGDVSVTHVPQRLEPLYGGDWVPGWMLFLRFRLGGAVG